MNLEELVKRIGEVQEKMDERFSRESDAVFFLVDMVEEVGELAEVIRAKEFYKSEPKEDLESELADIFYDLVGIARVYGVDLEEAVMKRLKKLEERFLK